MTVRCMGAKEPRRTLKKDEDENESQMKMNEVSTRPAAVSRREAEKKISQDSESPGES